MIRKNTKKKPLAILLIMLIFLINFAGGGGVAKASGQTRGKTPPVTTKTQGLNGPGPEIRVNPETYDFGTILQQVVSHKFTVENNGDGDLVIKKITTSCGCTKAQIDQDTILPGKKATLTVTFDPVVHDTRGKTTRTVTLETNDPRAPLKRIKIRAFVYQKGKSANEFPSFAYNSAKALKAYRFAAQVPDVLEVIPCYCECGIQSDHRNLKDCFIKTDGSFDEHASGCSLCGREAIDVKKWLDQKVPIKEIRNRIDKKYKQFGVPTPTPPI